MKIIKEGQKYKKTKSVWCGSHGCSCCGRREIYIYIDVLEVLTNVACIRELGQIEWVELDYFRDLELLN